MLAPDLRTVLPVHGNGAKEVRSSAIAKQDNEMTSVRMVPSFEGYRERPYKFFRLGGLQSRPAEG